MPLFNFAKSSLWCTLQITILYGFCHHTNRPGRQRSTTLLACQGRPPYWPFSGLHFPRLPYFIWSIVCGCIVFIFVSLPKTKLPPCLDLFCPFSLTNFGLPRDFFHEKNYLCKQITTLFPHCAMAWISSIFYHLIIDWPLCSMEEEHISSIFYEPFLSFSSKKKRLTLQDEELKKICFCQQVMIPWMWERARTKERVSVPKLPQ